MAEHTDKTRKNRVHQIAKTRVSTAVSKQTKPAGRHLEKDESQCSGNPGDTEQCNAVENET